jgi:hypothetical protein
MARPAGLEPATLGLEGRCSIQMSYGRIVTCDLSEDNKSSEGSGRGREIRTPDPLVPNQMRYQAALCPDFFENTSSKEGEMIRCSRENVND